MDKSLLRQLDDLTYGDLVRASWQRLIDLRDDFAGFTTEEVVPPFFPTHVQVQTIAGCNASCPMCPMSNHEMRKLQKGVMPRELFEKIVFEAAGYEECSVISPYLQNEPLLDPHLAERITTIKTVSRGRLSARIVTNGYFLDSIRLETLIDAGIDVISVSLNAYTPDTYAKVMGGLDFQKTIDNVERLLIAARDQVLVILTFMATTENQHELEEAINYWTSRGVLCGAFGLGTMTGNVPQFHQLKPTGATHRPLECFVPLEATSILCNGDVLLCCSDWARQSKHGNIANQSIYDIWHSHHLSSIRRDAIGNKFGDPICRKCLGQTKSPANLLFEGGGELAQVG